VEDRQQARHDNLPPARRLDNRERDQRIAREKQQARQYQTQVQTQIAPAAKAYAETLRHSGRNHGYRYQQQYYWRLLQMLAAWNWSSYNYYNDPYFYTGNDYRYWRGSNWYYVNRYAADYLRQAINYGYQEGYWAGRADREDGWRYDYRSAFVYRDANYGYRGFYVSRSEYNYYFREGFRRGYEDGYYGHRRYGRSYNGSDVILGSVLSLILNLQAYRW
jgi:flagellar biosynthesis/type III secretory pathway protein FliH